MNDIVSRRPLFLISRTVRRTIHCVLAVTLLPLFTERSHAAPPAVAPPVETLPVIKQLAATPEDRAMIEAFDALDTELAETHVAAIFNHLRSSPHWENMRKAILEGVLLPPQQLADARRYFGDHLAIAREAATWPTPEPRPIARAAGPIVIDGEMDEPSWQQAAALPLRYRVNSAAPIDPPVGTCRLLWDDTHLYAGFKIDDHDIQSPPIERDGPVYSADCVEVFVMGNPRFMQYWELNVSPSGSIYDMLGFWHPRKWGGEHRVEESIDGMSIGYVVDGTLNDSSDRDGGYVIEIAIPWSEIPNAGERPRAGQTLHLLLAASNLDMTDGRRSHQYISHTPVVGWYHNIRAYAPLFLEGTNE